MKTRLLVSVRTEQEAHDALQAGVDILDIKNPARGSLGRPSHSLVSSIVKQAGQVPVSMALGEWFQTQHQPIPSGITWAKVGLSRLTTLADRQRANRYWFQLQQRLHPTRMVGVVYADHVRVNGIHFDEMFRWVELARLLSAHTPVLLVDTSIKDGSSLLDWCSLRQLQRWQKLCRCHGIALALAGSLRIHDIAVLKKEVVPDIIAVRGVVCDGNDRAQQLQKDRVLSLVQYLREGS